MWQPCFQDNVVVNFYLLFLFAKAPWSWGRMHDFFCAFFRKDARSNPVANYKRKREKTARENRSKTGNEGAPAK